MKQHLANINIARFRHEPGDPRLADFVDNLELINGLGERSEGFVWRLMTQETPWLSTPMTTHEFS
jgi:hypothetical protein